MNNNIKQYNNIVAKIVADFVKRLYLEENIDEVPTEDDYDIMDYQWVNQGPVKIWDRYLSLDDILVCEANNLPTKSLMDYYDYDYERAIKGEERITNYYNYTKTIWEGDKEKLDNVKSNTGNLIYEAKKKNKKTAYIRNTNI